MNYVVVVINNKEQAILMSEEIEPETLTWPGPIIASGKVHTHNTVLTCDGFNTVNGKEIGSRGLRDEVLIKTTVYGEQ